MLQKLPYRIRVALYCIIQPEILSSEQLLISGSVADYFNLCSEVEYFIPKDLDIVVNVSYLNKLKTHFFVNEVEGLYKDNVLKECFMNILGCNIDLFVVSDSRWKTLQNSTLIINDIHYLNSQIRKQMHSQAIRSELSVMRRKKHLNRLTFYNIYEQ